jgi:lipopolysaccharide/colanic/teichoic acid biosynthesis glycosyltransferase
MEEWHRQRHVVLPGMTGLWQVGGRSEVGFDEMLELDMRYIETWSLRGDLWILWRTLSVVLGARGAY